MVMRVRLTVDVHSLSFKVRLKVLTLHPDLPPVADLEPYQFPPVDEAADCPLRDLERIGNLPKREEFHIYLLAQCGRICSLLSYNDSVAERCQLGPTAGAMPPRSARSYPSVVFAKYRGKGTCLLDGYNRREADWSRSIPVAEPQPPPYIGTLGSGPKAWSGTCGRGSKGLPQQVQCRIIVGSPCKIRMEAATDHRCPMVTRAIRRSWERGRAITHGRPLPYRGASRWRPGKPWRIATDRPPTPCASSWHLSAPPSPHPDRSCCGV